MNPVYRLPPYVVNSILNAQDIAEQTDWGLTAYGVPEAWKLTRGAGVRVAILDTGIDTGHSDLIGQLAVDPRDFTGSPSGSHDNQGHGTHCAGVVAARKDGRGVIGLAYEAKLIIGKVLGDDGSGQGANVAAGVRWAVQNGAHIISMSLGAPVNDPSIAAAIRDAVQSGVFVICAAGNSGPFNPVDIDYPGRMPEAVAVASINKAGKISDFSSRGPSVAIAAPGEQVLSTIPGNRWARMSGTSMATPFVAGVVALAVSRQMELGAMAPKPMKTRADLLEHLKAHAIDAGAPGFDTAAGWGVVNVDKLIEAEQPAAPVQPPPAEGEEFDFGGLKIHIPARAGDTVSLTFSK